MEKKKIKNRSSDPVDKGRSPINRPTNKVISDGLNYYGHNELVIDKYNYIGKDK